MTPSTVITIDPGSTGAAVLREVTSGVIRRVFPYKGDDTILSAVAYARAHDGCVALIERVWGSPIMGPSNAFSFGDNFGGWRLGFKVAGIPLFGVTPQRWQKVVTPHITGQGDARKAALKDAAIALFDLPIGDSLLPPKTRITLDNADALLISEYAVRLSRLNQPLGETL